MIEYLLEGLIF